MEKLVEQLRLRGKKLCGFLSYGEGGRERTGFTLVDLESGERVQLALKQNIDGWLPQGRFHFNPEALTRGRMILERAKKNRETILVVDEVGPLELDGKGWGPCLDELAGDHRGLQLWVSRNRIMERVMDRWNIPQERVMNMDPELLDEQLKKLERYE